MSGSGSAGGCARGRNARVGVDRADAARGLSAGTRARRGAARRRAAAAREGLAHAVGHGHAEPDAEPGAHAAARPAAGVARRVPERDAALVLQVLVEVARQAAAGALVERLGHLRRQGDVLDQHARQLEPVLGELGGDAPGQELAELVVVGGHVEHRDVRPADDRGEARRDDVPELIADLVGREDALGADDLADELQRVDDAGAVGAEGAHAEPRRTRGRGASAGAWCPT